MTLESEAGRLGRLKDRYMWLWPHIVRPLIDLERTFRPPNARTLVVGSGRIPRLSGPDIVNTDIRPFPGVHVVADARRLPFRDRRFDCVICHQVLEHVPDADAAIAEMHRVLKPNGVVIVTVPFYFPFHASPHDYRRWTVPGLRQSFRQFREVQSGPYYGPVAALLTAFQHFMGMLIPWFYPSYVVKIALGYLFLPVALLDYLARYLPNAVHLAASVYYVGARPPDTAD